MNHVEIKKSRNGLGVFAKTDFFPGDEVFEVRGTFMSCDEEDDVDEKTRANTFRFDRKKYISPSGEIGDFLNHSCDPNSGVVKKNNKLFVTAVKQVEKGEEITIDYSTILAPDESWEMDCNCGSEHCRKKIKRFNFLPQNIKRKYVSLNMVPDYILNY